MSLFFLVTGSLAILLALLANRLGLDSSPGWGRGRLALLFIGLVAYGISALSHYSKRLLVRKGSDRDGVDRIRSMLDRIKHIILSPRIGLVFGAIGCAAIAVYALWYSSAGRFPAFPEYSNDYIQLGEAFLHGQTSLLEQPGPELKALQNPYDYQQRLNIPYHWDASYYEGKYYLYWGPVPGLVFAAAEGLTRTPPSASLMVDLPFIGLGLVVLAILTLISKHFFPGAAGLTPGLFTLMALVNLPFLFLLGNPQIYHTSIIYGQFFLILGLLGWVIYIIKTEPAWLIMAGLGWGLAVGSRINLAVSVAIYAVFALVWMGRPSGWKPTWRKEGFLLIPLAVCGIGLGVYNLVRFGNPFETGQAYQLTIPVAHSSYFSLSYLPANLYIYLFYTLEFVGKFPFVKSALFDLKLLPSWIRVPPVMSFDHNVFGVLSSVPGLWPAVLAVPLILLAGRPAAVHKTDHQAPAERVQLFAMIALAGLGQFLFLMVFFFSAERYVPDFYLSLALCMAMLVWKVDELLKPGTGWRAAFWAIVTGLIVCTAGIGLLGGFGVPPQLFHSFNPALYGRLAAYWNDRFSWLFALLARLLGVVVKKPH